MNILRHLATRISQNGAFRLKAATHQGVILPDVLGHWFWAGDLFPPDVFITIQILWKHCKIRVELSQQDLVPQTSSFRIFNHAGALCFPVAALPLLSVASAEAKEDLHQQIPPAQHPNTQSPVSNDSTAQWRIFTDIARELTAQVHVMPGEFRSIILIYILRLCFASECSISMS